MTGSGQCLSLEGTGIKLSICHLQTQLPALGLSDYFPRRKGVGQYAVTDADSNDKRAKQGVLLSFQWN